MLIAANTICTVAIDRALLILQFKVIVEDVVLHFLAK